MSEYLGVKRFCEKCEYGKKKWKSVYCTNEESRMYGLKTNSVVCAPCFVPKKVGSA